jgi:Tol biopolymer transport system component
VVADNGTLVYVSWSVADLGAPRTLVWVDRQGHETSIAAPPRAYVFPRLSPDGMRLAVFAQDQESDIWLWDLKRKTLAQATFDSGFDSFPVWTPDGRRLIFTSDRAGARNLFWQAADGSGADERLSDSPNFHAPVDVTSDGRLLIFNESSKTGSDVMQMTLDGTRRVTTLLHSQFSERNGVVSPDGHWLAYEANDLGRFEIYVRPFPEINGGPFRVSAGGGTRPLWARSGQELFFVSSTGALMGVSVKHGPSWASTPPTMLVKEGYLMNPTFNQGRTYDVAADGRQFLMIKESGGAYQSARSLTVILNWVDELTRIVPTK